MIPTINQSKPGDNKSVKVIQSFSKKDFKLISRYRLKARSHGLAFLFSLPLNHEHLNNFGTTLFLSNGKTSGSSVKKFFKPEKTELVGLIPL